MASAGGHWNNLAEAEKLTQDTLLKGVVETVIKRNNPMLYVPIAQARNSGTQISWVKEVDTIDGDVVNPGIGGSMTWSESVAYTTDSLKLKITAIQRKLDTYVESIYGSVNNYEEQMMLETRKGLLYQMGDKFFYGDKDNVSSDEWDGVHALISAVEAGTLYDADIDGKINICGKEAALSLHTVRTVLDNMVYGCDTIFVNHRLKRRIDQAYYEKGMSANGSNEYMRLMGMIQMTPGVAGGHVLSFDGVPIIPTDFLVAEEGDDGSAPAQNAQRVKHSTGDKQYSMVFVKWGNAALDAQNPGLRYAFGNTDREAGFFNLEYFDKLETAIAKGFRMYNFGALLNPSKFCLARITDIEDVAITA